MFFPVYHHCKAECYNLPHSVRHLLNLLSPTVPVPDLLTLLFQTHLHCYSHQIFYFLTHFLSHIRHHLQKHLMLIQHFLPKNSEAHNVCGIQDGTIIDTASPIAINFFHFFIFVFLSLFTFYGIVVTIQYSIFFIFLLSYSITFEKSTDNKRLSKSGH